VHASCGELEGEAAFYECLSFAGGSFVDLDWTDPESNTVDKPGEFLLLEAAQRRDERKENYRSEKMRQYQAPNDAKPRDSKLTILLIDEMWPLVAVINDGLQAHGHNVLTAYSGRQGLEVLKKVHVDVVICELSLPDTDGWQVGKSTRIDCEERGRSKPPFIILTGALLETNGEEKMVDSGVDAILRKPVDLRMLETMVQSAYRRRHPERELAEGLHGDDVEILV
jgi:CheY-like chemotaxis protein